jgi:hypothetical protein
MPQSDRRGGSRQTTIVADRLHEVVFQRELFPGLRIRELPHSVEDFWPRAIESHDVVPARHDRQAIWSLAVAAAELNRHRSIVVFLRSEVVKRVRVLRVGFEVALGVLDSEL